MIMAGSLYSMDTLDKQMTNALGGMDLGGKRFHHITQKGMQFKTYELFVPGIFHLMFPLLMGNRL
jgi:hypothetical protein